MGTVYEAMNKSRADRSRRPGVPLTVEHPEHPAAPGSDSADEFDFIRYSLNTPTAAELDRLQSKVDAEVFTRKDNARPAREVEVSVSRIDQHLVAFYDCDQRASGEYTKLAGSLIAASGTQNLKRLLITSARHGEGRTSVLLNLACALAHSKKRVLVVDSDFKRPSVLRMLGVEAEVGITEALARGLPVGSAAVRIQPHGFVVLPLIEKVENPAEVLASNSFHEMLAAFEPDYDFILFDSWPLLDSADASLLLRLAATTLMVVRVGKTRPGHLGKAIGPLAEENLFGIVLNRAAE
jgi:Mrp family chromosome partitioning ATPase